MGASGVRIIDDSSLAYDIVMRKSGIEKFIDDNI